MRARQEWSVAALHKVLELYPCALILVEGKAMALEAEGLTTSKAGCTSPWIGGGDVNFLLPERFLG